MGARGWSGALSAPTTPRSHLSGFEDSARGRRSPALAVLLGILEGSFISESGIATRGGDMRRLRFLHIPKTAGTAFVDCLRRLYPGGHFAFTRGIAADVERYRRLDPGTRERITLFSGHAPRITGEPAIDGVPIVTFLREPILRTMSHCQHVSE